jgi:hypothetical protein
VYKRQALGHVDLDAGSGVDPARIEDRLHVGGVAVLVALTFAAKGDALDLEARAEQARNASFFPIRSVGK